MKTLNELMNDSASTFNSIEWEYDDNGYKYKFIDNSIIYEHRFLAEKALGKSLPIRAEIHHYNGNAFDNRLWNLVVCQDADYHALLHERTKLVFGDYPYKALKKASWEHRHGGGSQTYEEHIDEIKVERYIRALENRDWWRDIWSN